MAELHGPQQGCVGHEDLQLLYGCWVFSWLSRLLAQGLAISWVLSAPTPLSVCLGGFSGDHRAQSQARLVQGPGMGRWPLHWGTQGSLHYGYTYTSSLVSWTLLGELYLEAEHQGSGDC